MTREPGWYWVRPKSNWEPDDKVEWRPVAWHPEGYWWFEAQGGCEAFDHHMVEIDERRIERLPPFEAPESAP